MTIKTLPSFDKAIKDLGGSITNYLGAKADSGRNSYCQITGITIGGRESVAEVAREQHEKCAFLRVWCEAAHLTPEEMFSLDLNDRMRTEWGYMHSFQFCYQTGFTEKEIGENPESYSEVATAIKAFNDGSAFCAIHHVDERLRNVVYGFVYEAIRNRIKYLDMDGVIR